MYGMATKKEVIMLNGCLAIKNNKFYAVLDLTDEITGKRKRKWIPLGLPVKDEKGRELKRNKKQATDKLNELRATYDPATEQADALLIEWVREWLDQRKGKIEDTTLECYEIYADAYIIPYFASRKLNLNEVQPRHIEAFYMHLFKAGRKDGKGGLCVKTIKKIAVVLAGTFQYAMKNNAVSSNPVKFAEYPLETRPDYEGEYLSIEQTQKVLSAVKGTELEPVIILAANFGLRRRELLGLRWNAVDFDNGIITISDTVTHVKTVIEKPRTKNGNPRVIELDEATASYLKALRLEQQEQAAKLGETYKDSGDAVCRFPDGRRLTTRHVSTKIQTVLEQNGLPRVGLHGFRHGVISHLYQTGLYTVKDIANHIGHKEIQSTERYIHGTKGIRPTISREMANLLATQSETA